MKTSVQKLQKPQIKPLYRFKSKQSNYLLPTDTDPTTATVITITHAFNPQSFK